MSLAQITALMSRVGQRKPDLVRDRNVVLFVQECIEEARKQRVEYPAMAHLDR